MQIPSLDDTSQGIGSIAHTKKRYKKAKTNILPLSGLSSSESRKTQQRGCFDVAAKVHGGNRQRVLDIFHADNDSSDEHGEVWGNHVHEMIIGDNIFGDRKDVRKL